MLHNNVHFRPTTETFHEFLIGLVQWTLGVDWWRHQIKTPLANRHVAVKWKYAFARATKKASESADDQRAGNAFVTDASGPVWSLLTLGFDFYCLLAVNKLPAFLVRRLRDNRSFQAARYEVAVAAIMARAGYRITFLDEQEHEKKHCEFIATHGPSNTEIAVEAKSRIRSGTLHERGQFIYDGDVEGIARLLRKAKRQRPTGLPFLIFIDMNLPLSPELAPHEKPWVSDLKHAIVKQFGPPSPGRPDPFTCLVGTNFAHHFGHEDGISGRGEWGVVIPEYPEVAISDERLLHDLWVSLEQYDRVPAEV